MFINNIRQLTSITKKKETYQPLISDRNFQQADIDNAFGIIGIEVLAL